jgi:hypothetical protein
MLNIFLDTEFTNFLDTDLISMGMAAQSGEEFYVEVPYPDADCSPFVREAIEPLLDRDPATFCSKPDLGRLILNWLTVVRPSGDRTVQICYDYETDWALFYDALDGHIPGWVFHANVDRDVNELLRWDFYQQRGLSEHHALNDAKALRHAYRPR